MIQRLWYEEEPHPLCPVVALESFLFSTRGTKSFYLFIHPLSLTDLSLHKLRLVLCKLIRLANLESIPKSHDLRKMAASFAFFRSMNVDSSRNLVGWSSERVFIKHYL